MFIKFIPLQSLNYSIVLPNEVQISHIITSNGIQEIFSVNNINLNKGETYYFRLTTVEENLPLSMPIVVQPSTNAILEIEDGQNSDSVTIEGVGEKILKVVISSYNYYEFSGFDELVLFNSTLQQVNVNSPLIEGIYYAKTKIGLYQAKTFSVFKTGLELQINDSIVVAYSRIFKYELQEGENYEIRINASANSTFTTNIVIRDIEWQICPITKDGNLYSFNAISSVVFVDLTMENVSGQAGVFVLYKQGENEDIVQNVNPEEIYDFKDHNGAKFIKIPTGNYKLYVNKKMQEGVWLYEVNGNDKQEIIGQSNLLSLETVYNLVSTEEKTYMLVSDNPELVFFLSYANGDYRIGVKNFTSAPATLYAYNAYEFVIERYSAGAVNYVLSIPSDNATVFKQVEGGNNELITGNDGVYIFTESLTAIVEFSCLGIKTSCNYDVLCPKVLGQFEVGSDSLYFANYNIELTSNIYSFDRIEFILKHGDIERINTTYSSASTTVDIGDYIYDINLTVIVNHIYTDGTNEISVSGEFFFSVPYYEIDKNIDFYTNKIAIIEAKSSVFAQLVFANKTLIIPSTIKQIYFTTLRSEIVDGLNIVVAERSSELFLEMKDFTYFYDNSGIYVEGDDTVNLNIKGNCYILPNSIAQGYGIYGYNVNILGDGFLSVMAGKKPETDISSQAKGVAGIFARSLVVGVRELFVKGGTGGDAPQSTGNSGINGKYGYDGGSGGCAVQAVLSIRTTESCRKITFEGGDGGDGGATGFYYEITSGSLDPFYWYTTEVVYSTNSKRGNGGNGGNGGDGGPGGHGGNGGFGGDGNVGGIGGNGGHGGNGADLSVGGNGGNGGHGGYSYSTQLYERPGDGGNGGRGCDGTSIKHGTNGGHGGYGYNGGNGGNGGNFQMMPIPGNGGNGGDGYVGTPGAGGLSGNDVFNYGENGIDGESYSSYQNYPWNYD